MRTDPLVTEAAMKPAALLRILVSPFALIATPPVARGEAGFDPGAKMHIAFSVPYARYFLARLLQFQFYKAACDQAGWTGPLHRCSFYGNKAVGERLNAMLAMGHSGPWPDALEVSPASGKSTAARCWPISRR
jgi:hypothetical protein